MLNISPVSNVKNQVVPHFTYGLLNLQICESKNKINCLSWNIFSAAMLPMLQMSWKFGSASRPQIRHKKKKKKRTLEITVQHSLCGNPHSIYSEGKDFTSWLAYLLGFYPSNCPYLLRQYPSWKSQTPSPLDFIALCLDALAHVFVLLGP